MAVVLDEDLYAAALQGRGRSGRVLEPVLDRRPVVLDAQAGDLPLQGELTAEISLGANVPGDRRRRAVRGDHQVVRAAGRECVLGRANREIAWAPVVPV